jgi:hypothetical protein
VEIRSSDYEKNELDKLAPEILTAIRNKKRLLKLGTPYQFQNFSFCSGLNEREMDTVSRD